MNSQNEDYLNYKDDIESLLLEDGATKPMIRLKNGREYYNPIFFTKKFIDE